MKKLAFKLKLFAGLFLAQFNAQAHAGLDREWDYEDQSRVNYVGDTDLIADEASKSLYESGCDRLQTLEEKVNLTSQEIDEGLLLEEMIGTACENPKEYKMSSIAHKIKEF